MSLTISAASSLQYYGHFMLELSRRFGRASFRPTANHFPPLRGPRDGMYAVVPDGRRLFFATDDHPDLNEDALDWCDAYGKVNLKTVSRSHPLGKKLVALGPSFGCRWPGPVAAGSTALRICLADENEWASGRARLNAFFAHQRQRSVLSAYQPNGSEPNFLFLLATYWHQHPEANPARVAIWRDLVADHSWVTEGGFVGGEGHLESALICRRKYRHRDYLEQTRRSCAVLNTPAVHGCLGWKLGEFLALGKAIVTLPIEHELPGDFEPGRHALLVADADEAVEAFRRIRSERTLREQLEKNARAYFSEFVHPAAAVGRVLKVASSR